MRGNEGEPQKDNVGFLLSDKVEKKRYDPDKRRFDQDTDTRFWLAIWVAIVSTLWLVFVASLLTFSGCDIDSSVLIALLCTSTANVLGLPYIVLHGLFDRENKER